jgi:hypothetical protein
MFLYDYFVYYFDSISNVMVEAVITMVSHNWLHADKK